MRVLVMNDDNHSPMYVREDGIVYSNAQEFMVKCIAKPHNTEFKLAEYFIVNEPTGFRLSECSEDEVFSMFDALCDINNLTLFTPSFNEMFDIFWESADEWN